MRFSFSLIFLLLLCVQSCKNNKNQDPAKILQEVSKDEDFNKGKLSFQFDLPNDWYRIDTTLHGVFFCILMNNDSMYRPRVNVANESMHGKTQSNYILGTKEYLTNNATGIELLENGQFEVSGKNCSWYTYNSINNGIRREMIFYSIAVNDISYNITAGLNIGGRARYRKTINEIVKSFKLN